MKTEIDRKIAVIFVADVVGYSKHMEKDENATIKSYNACETILKKLLKKYKGSVFNTAGDSVLAEFPSAVNAVECGVDFQNEIKKRNQSDKTDVKLEFRLGINMGDVVKKEDNLIGDGVNIAARLEALAQPNGITISKSVYDFVVPKTKMTFNDLGVQKVKQNEFHAFDILLDPSQKRTLKTKSNSMLPIMGGIAAVFVVGIIAFAFLGTQSTTEKLQNKLLGKRILVQEIENLSSEDSGLNLSRGIQNQLISGLSPTVLIPIVAKEETDQINSKNIPIEDLESEYNVGFLIGGSTSVQGNKFRVNLELLDVGKRNVVWSFIKDFSTDDTFAAQDEIEFQVRKAIQEKFTMGNDFSDSFVKYFGTGQLYREVLKAWVSFQKKDGGNVGASYSEAFKKIKDDNPDNSQAHLLYAISLYNEEEGAEYYEKRKELLKSINKANKLDPNNPMVYPVKAYFEYRFDEETDLRSVIAFKGLDMEPDNYLSLLWTGHAFWISPALVSKFDFEMLFNSEYFERAIEIAPYGPPSAKVYLLAAYTEEKKMEKANILVDEMLKDNDKNLNFWGTVSKVFLLATEGNKDEARKIWNVFKKRNDLSNEDIFDNFFQFPFVTIHFGFFSNRFLPAIQETIGLSPDVLDSYFWNRDN